jgi:hypothetical protein
MGFFTAMAAAGAVGSAYSAYSQGQAAKAEAQGQADLQRRNAAISEKDALATEAKTQFDQVQQAIQGERDVSTLRAKAGGSGALLTEGAPLRLVAEQTFQNELQNALIGYGGQVQAGKYRSQAAGLRTAAAYSDATAKNAGKAGTLAAATSLLGNVGTMYDKGMFTSKTPKTKMTWGSGTGKSVDYAGEMSL